MDQLTKICTGLTSIATASALLVCTSAFAQCPADDDNGANDACSDTPSFWNDGTTGTQRVADSNSNGSGEGAGDDWYYLSLPPGASVDFTVAFSSANGDIDIRLFDACGGTLLDAGTSTSNSEDVQYTNAGPTVLPLRLRIYMFTNSGCNDYTLTTTVTGDTACTGNDSLELLGGDTCGASVALLAGQTSGLKCVAGDDDWYSISVPPLSGLHVTLQFHDDIGDVDLSVQAPCGIFQASSVSTSDDEFAQYVNSGTSAVTAFVRVYAFGGTCIDYNMSLEFVPCSSLEDALEPNDDCASAISQSAGSDSVLQVSDGDSNGFGSTDGGPGDDWWAISLDDGETLTVDVLFTHAITDIDIYLLDACGGAILASGTSTTDNEQVTYANSSGATVDVKLRVYSWTIDGCNLYDMEIGVVDTACVIALDDANEENDACATPSSASSGTGLFVAKGDDDWYGPFSVADGDRFSADVLFSHADVDIDIRLEGPCATFRTIATSATDNESLSWSNSTGATVDVFLRVNVWSGSDSDCGNYDFSTSQIEAQCNTLPDDGFEDNDECASAISMAANSLTTGLYVEKGDSDWWSVTVPNSATLDVQVLFSHADADIDVQTLDMCGGSSVGGGGSISDNEVFSFTNQTGARQTYKIQVLLWTFSASDCGTYDLDLTLSGGTGANIVPYCFGDGSGAQCPCSNNSTAGHPGGCAHQDGDGAILAGIGTPSVGADTLHFDVTSAAASSFALLTSSINKLPQMGACIGCGIPAFDGLRCAGGAFLRHGSRGLNASGATSNGWGPPNGPPGGLGAAAGLVAGQTRHYFAFFRTDGAQTCMQGQNSTNAVSVTWGP